MTCPVCGGKNSVIGSLKDCESIHRKRKCDECGYIFYTAEYDSPSSADYNEIMNEKARKQKEKQNGR